MPGTCMPAFDKLEADVPQVLPESLASMWSWQSRNLDMLLIRVLIVIFGSEITVIIVVTLIAIVRVIVLKIGRIEKKYNSAWK